MHAMVMAQIQDPDAAEIVFHEVLKRKREISRPPSQTSLKGILKFETLNGGKYEMPVEIKSVEIF